MQIIFSNKVIVIKIWDLSDVCFVPSMLIILKWTVFNNKNNIPFGNKINTHE